MEMPKGDEHGRMHGFQLWANHPRSLKMPGARYQDILAKDAADVTDDDGTNVRVIVGDFWGKKGPVDGVAAEPRYLDISVPPGKRKTFPVEASRHAFAYIFEGSGSFRDASAPRGVLTERVGEGESGPPVREEAGNRSLVLFDSGDEITVPAGEAGAPFLLRPRPPPAKRPGGHGARLHDRPA